MVQVTLFSGGVWLEAGTEAVKVSSFNIVQVVGELDIFIELHVAVHAYALVVPAEVHVVEGLLGSEVLLGLMLSCQN